MIRISLLIALFLLPAACSSSDTYVAADESGPRLSVERHGSVDSLVDIEKGFLIRKEGEIVAAQIDLVSSSNYEEHVEARAIWFEAGVGERENLTKHWKPIVLGADARETVRFPAPGNDVESCRIEIRGATPIDN